MKKRLLSILMALALCLGLLPTAALAAGTPVKYLNGQGQQEYYTGEYTELTNKNPGGTTWTTGCYVVTGNNVIINKRVTVSGYVHLILTDGCKLTVNGGIQVQDDDSSIDNGSPNTLVIYAQSNPVLDADGAVDEKNNKTGKLDALGQGNSAGIGGTSYADTTPNGGTITINGGFVKAECRTSGPGIGGGSGNYNSGGSGGRITINGGTVEAIGGGSAGIGGGYGGYGNPGDYGYGGAGGEIVINGGNVKASSNGGAGIGGATMGGSGGSITITGGNVTAISIQGAGIGGGNYGDGGTITITGGNVIAQSTDFGLFGGQAAGIGGGTKGDCGTVTISGGVVTATSCEGSGIGGGGYGGNGGNVTISGGTVTASSRDGSGIGGGSYGGDMGNFDVDSGTFQTQKTGDANGNAVLFASSIDPQSNKNNWHGVIFEGDADGIIYGERVTASDAIIIPTEKTLMIESGKTLNVEAVTLTNYGSIYVDGTLKGQVTNLDSGAVCYPLTVTGGTAGGAVSEYLEKNYGKAGGTVTLTGTDIPDGQVVDSWTTSDEAVTVTNHQFTMPFKALHVTVRHADALNITAQPTGGTITYGDSKTLSVTASKHSSLTAPLTYQWYEGSSPISGATGSSYTTPADLAAGDHTYHCVITCGAYSITSNSVTVTVNQRAEAVPAISIDYENETLTGFVSGSSYTINGTAVKPTDGKLSVAGYIGSTISIVTKARDNNHTDSAAQTLNIPVRPDAPSLRIDNSTESVTVPSGYCYNTTSANDSGAWTAGSGSAVTVAPDSSIYICKAATASAFKSNVQTLSAPSRGATPTVAVDYTAETLSTTTAMEYSTDSGASWTDCTANMAATTFGWDGSAAVTVQFRTKATADNYASQVQTVPLPARPDAPGVPTVKSKTYHSVTLEEIPGAQYSKDGGATWQDSPTFTALTSNTSYSFVAQYKATDTSFASPVSESVAVTTDKVPASIYPPTVEQSEGGTVTTSSKNPPAGDKVTITPTPEKGYMVDQVIVTDQNGNPVAVTDNGDGTYTFTQPKGRVTISVTFKEIQQAGNPFADVFPSDYYYDAVLWAAENGITGGVDDTHFAPNSPCTRAQAVTFLWRAAGCPAPQSSEMPFTDVAAGSYYYDAVLWAVENGITKGTSDTTFSPDAVCSRGQIVTFLWRSQGSPAAAGENTFTDVAADSYCADAVLWAVENGITKGTSDSSFSPANDCTRGQIVTFLFRCLG